MNERGHEKWLHLGGICKHPALGCKKKGVGKFLPSRHGRENKVETERSVSSTHSVVFHCGYPGWELKEADGAEAFTPGTKYPKYLLKEDPTKNICKKCKEEVVKGGR